jgi:hypothetical protein
MSRDKADLQFGPDSSATTLKADAQASPAKVAE